MAKEIVIYGTSWCPDTARARRCFARNGIEYTWCDIEVDSKGRAFVELKNGGKRRVPTIVFPDGSVLIEPGDADLEKRFQSLKK